MSDDPKPKPRFWPLLFITAFVLGAVLWALWMCKIIHQTRELRRNRGDTFFVPMQTNPPAPAPRTNSPAH